MGLTELFSGIAAAIRLREGSSGLICAQDFPERIQSLPQGSGIELEQLSIVTPPAKTVYYRSCLGAEAFDPAGMTLSARVGDGSASFSFPVTAGQVSFSHVGALPAGTQAVTALFALGGRSVQAAQAVTVQYRAPSWAQLESACAAWTQLEALVPAWGALETA